MDVLAQEKEQICLSVPFLFYSSPQLIEWCPPASPLLSKCISFTLSTSSNVNLFWKHSHGHTQVIFYQLSGHPLAQPVWHIKLNTTEKLHDSSSNCKCIFPPPHLLIPILLLCTHYISFLWITDCAPEVSLSTLERSHPHHLRKYTNFNNSHPFPILYFPSLLGHSQLQKTYYHFSHSQSSQTNKQKLLKTSFSFS